MGKGKKKEFRGPKPVARDRFSGLPDSIFHQILSLVSTVNAVRMSLVSKRWRHICHTLPALSFMNSDFDDGISPELRCSIVSNCLRLREADMVTVGNAPVTKFKLESESCDYFNVDDWLGLITKSKVKELDLSVLWMDDYYFLPADVLCMRSLTHLRLCWVNFDNDLPPISLPNLMSLVLENSNLNDKILDDLLLGCSSLEKCLIDSCCGFIHPGVSSPRLKSLDFRTHERKPLQVEATNLESIVSHGCDIHLKSNLSLCRNLTILTFDFIERNDKWFEELISRLPCLESLVLHCGKSEYVEIHSPNLRHLTLCIHRSDESEVIINAPKLVHFSFFGNPAVEISMNVPNLLEVNVQLFCRGKHNASWYKNNVTWYTNLIYFLSKLDCYSKSLVLHVYSEEALIIPNRLIEICKAPLPTLKHLTVRTPELLLGSNELKESLFWMIPSQETLQMEQATYMGCPCFMMY